MVLGMSLTGVECSQQNGAQGGFAEETKHRNALPDMLRQHPPAFRKAFLHWACNSNL